MTNEAFIPLQKILCKIPGVENIKVGESITFEYNDIVWSIAFVYKTEGSLPFKLYRNGVLILGFIRPEALTEFLSK